MKHKINKIITAVLTLALMLTSVAAGNTTVYAAEEYAYVLMDRTTKQYVTNGTITLNVGDKTNIQFLTIRKYDDGRPDAIVSSTTHVYDWKSSDESTVSLCYKYELNVAGKPTLSYIEVRAEKEGKATVTGTRESDGRTVSVTVVVKAPKMTAKQKKCKHSWKTTRKATCMRNGVKTCKKCKFSKVIKQKAHKFVTTTNTYTLYDEYPIWQCNGCACREYTGIDQYCENLATCPHPCGQTFDAVDYDLNNNGIIDAEDTDAAYEAMIQHQIDNRHGSDSVSSIVGYTNPHDVVKTMDICKTCGQSKEQIKNAGQL